MLRGWSWLCGETARPAPLKRPPALPTFLAWQEFTSHVRIADRLFARPPPPALRRPAALARCSPTVMEAQVSFCVPCAVHKLQKVLDKARTLRGVDRGQANERKMPTLARDPADYVLRAPAGGSGSQSYSTKVHSCVLIGQPCTPVGTRG